MKNLNMYLDFIKKSWKFRKEIKELKRLASCDKQISGQERGLKHGGLYLLYFLK